MDVTRIDDGAVARLMAAVRRRLWRLRVAATARHAAWGAAGLMLLAAAAHALWPGTIGAAASTLAALALPAAAAASRLRRPSDDDCALWADRHLAGASAYSTWLESRASAPRALQAQAVHALEHWAAQRTRLSLRLLHESPAPWRLARPLAALAVCGTLAWLAMSLVEPVERASALQQPAATDLGLARTAAQAPSAADDFAAALRAGRRDDPDRPGAAGTGPARAGSADASAAPQAARTPAAGQAAAAASSGAAVAEAPPGTPVGGAGGPGSPHGRDAGDSPDRRADVGVSRAAGGAPPVPRSAATLGRSAPQQAVDAGQAGMFDDRRGAPSSAPAAPAPVAAATPPPATDARPLSPTETSYVHAWMKATERRR